MRRYPALTKYHSKLRHALYTILFFLYLLNEPLTGKSLVIPLQSVQSDHQKHKIWGGGSVVIQNADESRRSRKHTPHVNDVRVKATVRVL